MSSKNSTRSERSGAREVVWEAACGLSPLREASVSSKGKGAEEGADWAGEPGSVRPEEAVEASSAGGEEPVSFAEVPASPMSSWGLAFGSGKSAALVHKEGAPLVLKESAPLMHKEDESLLPKEGATLTEKEAACLTPQEVAALVDEEAASLTPQEGAALLMDEGLSATERCRLEWVQRLLGAGEGRAYRAELRRASRALGVSERSVRRWVQRYRQRGLVGLVRAERSDKGGSRLSEQWQEFILGTWRSGNRGGRRMSPAQVYVRVAARAESLGVSAPSRSSVYRLLAPEIARGARRVGSIGWHGGQLQLVTRTGERLGVRYSNQVWQIDHTRVDVLVVVDGAGAQLQRPWLTTVLDSYSRCLMGYYLGFESPSAWTVCLALRQAILPKRYGTEYGLRVSWDSYGVPEYVLTDGGQEFHSAHLEQVATALGIALCLRRRPSEGGIVERPFGTFNSELWSSLPGYTGSGTHERPAQAASSACLSLKELEHLFVRYVVERYNQSLDSRTGNQTRFGRWEAGRLGALSLPEERSLDMCLLRRERRKLYRRGYLQFANLVYWGEGLGAFAGEEVVVRYNPRDITTILVYRRVGKQEVLLGRAEATDLHKEELSLSEVQAIARRLRSEGRMQTNRSVLEEVQSRDAAVAQAVRQHRRACATGPTARAAAPSTAPPQPAAALASTLLPVPDGASVAAAVANPSAPSAATEGIAAVFERLARPSLVELASVGELHAWLDEKRRGRQSCRVIGESGTGKSVACEAYRLLHPPRLVPGALSQIPVCSLQAPREADGRECLLALLRALGYPLTPPSLAEVRERVVEQLHSAQVEMLILDGAQRLHYSTFAELVDLSERVSVAIVLVGTPVLETLLRRDEQVWNRFLACFRFSRLTAEQLAQTSAVWEEQVLRLSAPSHLSSPTMQKVLLPATLGLLSTLDALLREAALRALRKGHAHIDLATLLQVAREYQ